MRRFALDLLRASLGLMFLFAGYTKVAAPDPWLAHVNGLGLPSPTLLAPLIAWLEFVGGAALLLGLYSRLLGLLFAGEMLVVLFRIHLPEATRAAFSYTPVRLQILAFAACLCVAYLGPGVLSLDRLVSQGGQSRQLKA